MTDPKQHHYVPKSYLAGFTFENSISGRLFVYDMGELEQWLSSPEKAGKQKNFYKLNEDADDPLVLEKQFFQQVEDWGVPVIKEIIRTGKIPQGKDYEHFIGFIATQYMRVPNKLAAIDSFYEKIMRNIGWHLTESKENWEANAGKWDDSHSWEEMRSFARGDDYSVQMDQTSRMGLIVRPMITAYMLLENRNWSFVEVPEGCHGFLSSDNPVVVQWCDNKEAGPMGPAIGMPDTMVLFPLNRHCAVAGIYSKDDAVSTIKLDNNEVASLNAVILSQATRFAYSYSGDVEVRTKNGDNISLTQLMPILYKAPDDFKRRRWNGE
jgi:hypothetical protein